LRVEKCVGPPGGDFGRVEVQKGESYGMPWLEKGRGGFGVAGSIREGIFRAGKSLRAKLIPTH
jgi:hypothetical protein